MSQTQQKVRSAAIRDAAKKATNQMIFKPSGAAQTAASGAPAQSCQAAKGAATPSKKR